MRITGQDLEFHSITYPAGFRIRILPGYFCNRNIFFLCHFFESLIKLVRIQMRMHKFVLRIRFWEAYKIRFGPEPDSDIDSTIFFYYYFIKHSPFTWFTFHGKWYCKYNKTIVTHCVWSYMNFKLFRTIKLSYVSDRTEAIPHTWMRIRRTNRCH